MELRHLRYFDALAETLNFTRAAERLHVTQSTLSHQIKQLEEELGTPLFDRSGKHVRMTEAGEVLRSHMTPALEKIDLGLQALRAPGEAITGSIRLGTTPSFNTRMVPQCVATLLNAYPGIEVSVEELAAGQILKRLRSGHLDIAVSYPPGEGSDLWFEPLYKEELRLVVGIRHPLARRRRVRMVELHHVRMVLLHPPRCHVRRGGWRRHSRMYLSAMLTRGSAAHERSARRAQGACEGPALSAARAGGSRPPRSTG